MTKVAEKQPSRSTKQTLGSVKSKTVVHSDGRKVRMLSIDANSATFGEDLQLLFAKNVAKARRDNMKKFGNPDRVEDN